MTTDERLAAVIAQGLRSCRVEDGSPAPLIHEDDIDHATHMVAAALTDAGWMHRDDAKADDRLAAAEATIKRYEHGISWDTTCENCANMLDRWYAEIGRAEVAEDALDEHRAHYVDPVEHARVVAALARVAALADEWETTVYKLPPGYPMTVNEFCRVWFKASLRTALAPTEETT